MQLMTSSSDNRGYGKPHGRGAFTLVEVLVATALTLIIMAVTVTLFGNVTENIAGSRAVIEVRDRLRSTQERLVLDLRAVTAPMLPPLNPEDGLGYFEYVEGPVGSFTNYPANTVWPPFNVATPGNSYAVIVNEDKNGDGADDPDTTYADSDDILMFTVHSPNDPFTGLGWQFAPGSPRTVQSKVAEVAWFVRGTTLYRRVLLVMPQEAGTINQYWSSMDTNNDRVLSDLEYNVPFYRVFDISARAVGGADDPHAGYGNRHLVPNSLGDLTKRENRYAHQPKKTGTGDTTPPTFGFPHSIARWGQLGLPTLQECSKGPPAPEWPFPIWSNTNSTLVVPVAGSTSNFARDNQIDFWNNPHPWTNPAQWGGVDATTGVLNAYASGLRVAEDVILTNVIGFDVKAWDPEAPIFAGPTAGTTLAPGDIGYPPSPLTTQVGEGAYVDLGYANNTTSQFSSTGNYPSTLPRVYDTWSTHYESDGIDQDGDGTVDEGTDGIDNNNLGGIDDASEREAPPPYPAPLRGIQVKIRVFEPDSRSIREVTVVQDFLPE
jgi:type II secretory pathway pseudopilin PulG